MGRKRGYQPTPLPPANADDYILVKTKEGKYWRRKRGTVKKAALNQSLKKNAELTAVCSPAAKRISEKLSEYLRGLDTGRFIANVSAKLKRSVNRNGKMDFSFFDGYDLQPDYPITRLMDGGCSVIEIKGLLNVKVNPNSVKCRSNLLTDFYFDAVLLYGDPSSKNKLRIESDTSPVYTFSKELNNDCSLTLALPAKKIPWMMLLRVTCREGNIPAVASRHHGMKVYKVGN